MANEHTCKQEGMLGRIESNLESINEKVDDVKISINTKVDGIKSSQDHHFTKIYNTLEGQGDNPGIKIQTALNKTSIEESKKDMKRLWKWGGGVLGVYGIILSAIIVLLTKKLGS